MAGEEEDASRYIQKGYIGEHIGTTEKIFLTSTLFPISFHVVPTFKSTLVLFIVEIIKSGIKYERTLRG